MKMKTALFILPPLVLAACTPVRRAADVPQLKGKPLSAATRLLGQPQESIRQGGTEDVYVWTHDETWNTSLPAQAGPDISVVGKSVVYHRRPMGLSGQRSFTWTCRLSITTDKGRITGARYWGDPPACDYFDRIMNP